MRFTLLPLLPLLFLPSWAAEGAEAPREFDNAIVQVLDTPPALVVEVRSGGQICILIDHADPVEARVEPPPLLVPREGVTWIGLLSVLRAGESPEQVVAAAVRATPTDAALLVYVALLLYPVDKAGAVVSAVVSELPPAAAEAVQIVAIEAGVDPVVVTTATAAGLAATTPPVEVDVGTSTPAAGSGGGRPASGS